MSDAIALQRQIGTTFEGVYQGSKVVRGTYRDDFIHMFTVDGRNQDVWGLAEMNRQLERVQPGSRVQVCVTAKEPMGGDRFKYLVTVKDLSGPGEGNVGISRFKLRLPEIDRTRPITF